MNRLYIIHLGGLKVYVGLKNTDKKYINNIISNGNKSNENNTYVYNLLMKEDWVGKFDLF